MLGNATEMTAVMSLAVAWLQEGSMLAAQIVDAYTLALESMIPGEVCTTNRTTQAGLISTNIGQNTPAIIALELEYMGHFWTQNASMMATYQAVVSAALAALATPPPLNPAFADPAGPLAGVVQAGADAAAGSLQSGFQSVTQTASSAVPATQAPASAATDGMSQAMSMPMQMVGMLGRSAASRWPANCPKCSVRCPRCSARLSSCRWACSVSWATRAIWVRPGRRWTWQAPPPCRMRRCRPEARALAVVAASAAGAPAWCPAASPGPQAFRRAQRAEAAHRFRRCQRRS